VTVYTATLAIYAASGGGMSLINLPLVLGNCYLWPFCPTSNGYSEFISMHIFVDSDTNPKRNPLTL